MHTKETTMIINKRNLLNLDSNTIHRDPIESQLQEKTTQEILNEFKNLTQLNQVYEAALNEIATKLENLNAEFQINFNHNPIHHMEGRMKSLQSIIGKMKANNLPIKMDMIKDNIFDVAGIRVITNYIEDIYTIEKLLTSQDDIRLVKRKDYVANPKENGYRSLHLVVTVPVFLSSGTKHTHVEIQIRTIGMDMWASLEHKLRYKTDTEKDVEQFSNDLKSYSVNLHEIETKMQSIHQELK